MNPCKKRLRDDTRGLAGVLRWAALAVLVSLGFGGIADRSAAVMPPDVYIDARAAADHHVQVALHEVRRPAVTPGLCGIEASVITVFRSHDQQLAQGTPVAFTVDCLGEADEPIPGGTLWGRVGDLQQARYIEVYLDGPPGALEVARWQYGIIEGPTDAPQCPEHTLACR